MHCFKIGEKVEALDNVGHWALAEILEINNGNYYVSFDGWGNRWNRLAEESEVRKVTEVMVCSLLRIYLIVSHKYLT